MKVNLFCLIILLCVGCASSKTTPSRMMYMDAGEDRYLLTSISEDPSYGYNEKSPVSVGGGMNNGPRNERKYLNSLTGPEGQPVKYVRVGSCCHFQTPNGISGTGLLDKYSVTWEGRDEPVILYINMYDEGELMAPAGFGIRKL